MPELVAQTSQAVAVDDSLTTLIDWVNIEAVSGFTIIVENTGGGSANALTDIQIDTSNDGGITINTDQHDGVPAVPITSGNSKKGTFTETAKFVRIRAVCAENEDTTVNAWLLADLVIGRICTLADVKDRLGISDTEQDSIINRIIVGLEEVFRNYVNRHLLLNLVDVTEYYSTQGSYLQLLRYPVVSITSIKEAWDYDFSSADVLTEDTDYRKIRQGINGILYRIGLNWATVDDGIQVIYKGGYCSAGQTPGESEFAMPADLREAAIEQTSFLFKRKNDLGLAGVGFQGGSISKFSAIDLLPMVKQVLNNYKRPSL